MHKVEIELKFPLKNKEHVVAQLSHLGSPKTEHQKDVYYIPAHRNFLAVRPVSEWLRIRESDKETTINYKKWHKENNPKAVSCDEFESAINDAPTVHAIFQRLDFTSAVIVDKKRRTWKYKKAAVSIDEVESLGCFIEIEAEGEFANIKEAKRHLHALLDDLQADVGEQDFKGYPYLLLERKGLL